MRRHLIRTLLVGGAVAAAVTFGAGQAFAAGITITGANTTFTTTGTVSLSDASSGQNFSCPLSPSGSLANVTNAALPYTTTQANGSAHSITGGTACTSGSATVTPVLPWDIVFTALSTTPPQATGVVEPANASGLLFRVSVLSCSFGVAGQASISWTDGTSSQLKFTGTGTLHPADIGAGCFGLVSSTDSVQLTGGLTFTPGTITIT